MIDTLRASRAIGVSWTRAVAGALTLGEPFQAGTPRQPTDGGAGAADNPVPVPVTPGL